MSLKNIIRLKDLIKDLSSFLEIRDLDVIVKENKIEFWFTFTKGNFEEAKNYINSLEIPNNIDIILIEEN